MLQAVTVHLGHEKSHGLVGGGDELEHPRRPFGWIERQTNGAHQLLALLGQQYIVCRAVSLKKP